MSVFEKLINEIINEIIKDLDNKCIEFLNKNGYKIEKPYTKEKVLYIKEQLKQEGKRLTYECVPDIIEYDEEIGSYQVHNKIIFKLEDL